MNICNLDVCNFLKFILNSPALSIVVGGLLTGYFGFRQYRNQKSWEIIDKRYFENGIESLIVYLNKLRLVCENNYSNSLLDLSNLANHKKLELKYERVSLSMPNSFLITLSLLEGNEDFGSLCTDIFIESGFVNNFFVTTFPIKLKDIQRITDIAKRKVMIKKLQREISEIFERIRKRGIYDTIENLEDILFRLRKINVNSYKKLENAKNDKIIKELLINFKKIKQNQTAKKKL